MEKTEEKKPEEQKVEVTAVQDIAATPSAPQKAASTTIIYNNPEMSPGEKWFNRLLYTGLNYWVNLGISLMVTDFFLHGGGKKWYTGGVSKIADRFSKWGMKRENAKWGAEIALGTLSLNSGGNLLLIPTKFIEDRKRQWVYWLNEKMGVDQTAPDGTKLTAENIFIEQEQDPQSWPRMIGRRILGWVATTATGMTLDKVLAKAPLKTHYDQIVVHTPGQQVFTEGTLRAADNILKSGLVPGGHAIANSPTARRYMGYAALDWIYTIITSKILHATNGAHKKKNDAPIVIEHNTPQESATAGTPASPPATVEIGDSLKPGEHLEPVVVPKGKHAADLLRGKDKEEGFAAALAKQSEAAASKQLGA